MSLLVQGANVCIGAKLKTKKLTHFFEIVENCFFTRTFTALLCFWSVIFCFGVGHDLGVGAVFRFVGRMTYDFWS